MRTHDTDPASAGSFHERVASWRQVTVVHLQAPRLESEAEHLAHRLGLTCMRTPRPHHFRLLLTDRALELHPPTTWRTGPVVCDFERGPAGYRLAAGRAAHTNLARAVGRHGGALHIVDATAGLGVDALSLAALGHQLTLVERHPLIACLLSDGLQRAKAGRLAPLIERVQLIEADAAEWLAQRPVGADVVYLDPMFPARHGDARARKEMQILQTLVGADPDADALLEAARMHARRRVVVKRPRRVPSLPGQPPDLTVTGRSTRFDVYLARPPRT